MRHIFKNVVKNTVLIIFIIKTISKIKILGKGGEEDSYPSTTTTINPKLALYDVLHGIGKALVEGR